MGYIPVDEFDRDPQLTPLAVTRRVAEIAIRINDRLLGGSVPDRVPEESASGRATERSTRAARPK